MAQNIILKRSALPGKVPTTSSLDLGEMAINTWDGRAFLHVSNSAKESIEHIVTTNSTTTGSITITQTGSFGELIITQDGNFNRDIFVVGDIVGNGDLDIGGTITASLQQGYVLVGNGGNNTIAIPTSSLVTDLSSLTSKTGSYATTGSNKFIGNQYITGAIEISGSNSLVTFDPQTSFYSIYQDGVVNDLEFILETNTRNLSLKVDTNGTYIVPTNSQNRIVFNQNSVALDQSLNVTGSFTASLQNGYAWVGNGNGKSVAVATSSFAGGVLPSGILSSSNTNFSQFTSSVNNRLNSIESVTSSYETTGRNIVSSSANTTSIVLTITNGIISAAARGGIISSSAQLTEFELKGSGILSSSNVNFQNYTASINSILNSINSVTNSFELKGSGILSSSNITFDNFTASINNYTQSSISRFDNIELQTGSYATTGSNTFYGDQIISGSTYINGDLIVIGSSSISNISASAVSIGTNTVILNTFAPSVRYAGISVYDSGSAGGTGSLWWDSLNNHWIYEHPADSEAPYNSAILISGPPNTGDLGDEIGLTAGKLTIAIGEDHISSSQITDDGENISINGNLIATGSFTASLESGYVWVGNGEGNGLTTLATSSFSALRTKAGGISGSAFTGVLRKATVTFSIPFPNNQYAVTVTGEDARVFTIESKTSGSFTINSNTRSPMSGITYWIATSYGEMS